MEKQPHPPQHPAIEQLETVALVVNARNEITHLSDNWSKTARAGQAAQALAVQKLLNKPLTQFITSDTTRMYVEACLQLCRLRQEVLFRPYRCDSPTHQRFMELQLTPLADKAVEMKHFLLAEKPFVQPVQLQDASQLPQKTSSHWLRCSFCNRLKPAKERVWQPPEFIELAQISPLQVIHTICHCCEELAWLPRG